jgi:DNA polymerase-4
MRSIMHFYINSFCAHLEQLRNPEIARKPVIVTHRSGNGEFVVSASPEAKLQGVREGITSRRAGRYCPDGIFLPVDWKMYKETSRKVMDILSYYSPLLEPHGLDRAYMDVTGCFALFESPRAIAREVQQKVMQAVKVLISIGIAENKLAASAAASSVKAGECLEVKPGGEKEVLASLSVSFLPGVGEKIEKRLLALGIITVGELAAIPERMLARQLGITGSRLHRLAQGIDPSPVLALYPPETFLSEHTFGERPGELEVIQVYLLRMSDELSGKLRDQNQKAGKVSLRIEFENGEVYSSSYVPKIPVSSIREIYVASKRLIGFETEEKIVSIKLALSDLRAAGGIQLSYLDDTERRARLDALLRNVRSKFGDQALVLGEAIAA